MILFCFVDQFSSYIMLSSWVLLSYKTKEKSSIYIKKRQSYYRLNLAIIFGHLRQLNPSVLFLDSKNTCKIKFRDLYL